MPDSNVIAAMTAEVILRFADDALSDVPEGQQLDVLEDVCSELELWLQAVKAGQRWKQIKPPPR